MKTFNMKLFEEPFNKIKSGEKKIELRLNEDKRKEIRIGDLIEFTKLPEKNETLTVKVVGLTTFNSFLDLFTYINLNLLGKENLSIEDRLNNIRKIYSEEKENEFGVLGIYIEKQQ